MNIWFFYRDNIFLLIIITKILWVSNLDCCFLLFSPWWFSLLFVLSTLKVNSQLFYLQMVFFWNSRGIAIQDLQTLANHRKVWRSVERTVALLSKRRTGGLLWMKSLLKQSESSVVMGSGWLSCCIFLLARLVAQQRENFPFSCWRNKVSFFELGMQGMSLSVGMCHWLRARYEISPFWSPHSNLNESPLFYFTAYFKKTCFPYFYR